MTKRKVVMIEGDGIGPELCQAVRTVIAGTGAPIEWVMADAGLGCLERHGTPLPDATLALLREHRVGIKGPTDTPSGGGHRSVNVRLREELELFAGVRPVRTLGAHHRLAEVFPNVNLVIVRENLEDLYAGHELVVHDMAMLSSAPVEVDNRLRIASAEHARIFTGTAFPHGTAIALKVITPERTRRICRYAFEYARRHGRKRVTCVHKANILKLTDGLFLAIFKEVAAEYPDIAADDFIVDAMAMRLVRTPEQFDVLVCPNLYGDILSDLCAALVGGLGVVPGANIGDDIALFEAVHGTAPDIAGQNKANPTSLLLSAVEMLEHLAEIDAREHPSVGDQWGYGQQAQLLRTAIERIVSDGECVTADIWQYRSEFGTDTTPLGTQQMAAAIALEYHAVVDEENSQ